MKTIGVYGSLKAGCYNHNAEEMTRVGDAEIMGAMDLFASSYPRLYPMGYMPEKETVHPLEIYEVSDEYFKRLDAMERGAGYQQHEIIVHTASTFELPVTVWLMNPAYEIDMEQYITSYPPKK